jgi:A/G-specific adenine glycosylase
MPDFKLLITDWYRQNKRDLPWRNTIDPYKIWMSEVILQQTRVEQGLPYYIKFTERFEDIHALALANEQEVLQLWQGLGYYSRGRNLHQTAKFISQVLNGVFPDSSRALIKLQGIGPYTAAAIASFCYNEIIPVIDGNVNRVLSRVFNVEYPINTKKGQEVISDLANLLIDKKDPATYNQAIMEFGALQCTPVNPECEVCCLQSICLSYQKRIVDQRPVKIRRQKIRNRYFHFAFISDDSNIVLTRRTDKDIWQHLFQFPVLETNSDVSPSELLPSILTSDANRVSSIIKHVLSHQHIYARFYHFKLSEVQTLLPAHFFIINKAEITSYPLPRLIDKYLQTL